jgi:hypothetical protein
LRGPRIAIAAVSAVALLCARRSAAEPPRSRESGARTEGRSTTKARRLDELVDKKEPGIDLVRSWVKGAKNQVEVLMVERAAGERTLVALQITSRSPMGALALETGGLLVDHGWIRILGGGGTRLPRSLSAWNGMEGRSAPPRGCSRR